MKQNVTEKSPKVAHLYQCVQCDYNTSKKYDFTKHLLTIKHKKCENVTLCNQKVAKSLNCICGNVFTNRTTLWRHRSVCDQVFNISKKEYKQTLT
jgi:hypothetical protein